MPAGWAPVAVEKPGRSGRRSGGRRRRRRPRGAAVLLTLLALGGVWWAWSPAHRETTGEVLAQIRAAAGLPGEGPRQATDGSRLPPAGLEEASARLAPVVVPELFSDRYVFKSPGESPISPNGWSPCRPIHYVVDVTGAPVGFGETVRTAVAEVSGHTGLTFVDDGDVIETAVDQRESYLPQVYGDRWAPVLIRFTDDATVPDLAGDTVGLAGGAGMTSPSTGRTHYVSGTVYLDLELVGMPALGGVPAYLPVLRHELGHLVGLDHVDDPTQIMYPTTGFASTYQSGDLTGLSILGQAACAPDL